MRIGHTNRQHEAWADQIDFDPTGKRVITSNEVHGALDDLDKTVATVGAAFPTSPAPVAGDWHLNTTDNHLYYWTGTAWLQLSKERTDYGADGAFDATASAVLLSFSN